MLVARWRRRAPTAGSRAAPIAQQRSSRPPRSDECLRTKGIASSDASRTIAWATFRWPRPDPAGAAADERIRPGHARPGRGRSSRSPASRCVVLGGQARRETQRWSLLRARSSHQRRRRSRDPVCPKAAVRAMSAMLLLLCLLFRSSWLTVEGGRQAAASPGRTGSRGRVGRRGWWRSILEVSRSPRSSHEIAPFSPMQQRSRVLLLDERDSWLGSCSTLAGRFAREPVASSSLASPAPHTASAWIA